MVNAKKLVLMMIHCWIFSSSYFYLSQKPFARLLIQTLCHPGSKTCRRWQRQGLRRGWWRREGEGENGLPASAPSSPCLRSSRSVYSLHWCRRDACFVHYRKWLYLGMTQFFVLLMLSKGRPLTYAMWFCFSNIVQRLFWKQGFVMTNSFGLVRSLY